MEVRNLVTFLTVAETKNFTRAAERLGYSQSAVTVQIKHLETELGVKLFDRIGKTAALTNYGKAFIEYADSAVKAMDKAAAFNAETGADSGILRFGVVGSILSSVFSDVLLEYRRRFPNVTVSIFEGSSAELEKKIRKSELDLAYFLDFKSPSNDWVRIREEKEPVIFVCNPDNPLCQREAITFDEMKNENFILMPNGENYRTIFNNELVKHNVSITPALEIVNTDLIIKLLKTGPFVSIMPEFAMRKHLAEGSVAEIKVKNFDMYQYSQFAYLKGKVITPHIKGFIDTVLENC